MTLLSIQHESTHFTMLAMVEAVETYATLGEISDVFRTIFGEQDV